MSTAARRHTISNTTQPTDAAIVIVEVEEVEEVETVEMVDEEEDE